jgi:hypothetical protein
VHAAQVAVADQGDEDERRAGGADAQVRRRRVQDIASPAQRVRDRGPGGEDEHHERRADAGREPQRLRGHGRRAAPVAASVAEGDAGRRPVGEEVEHEEGRVEDGGCDREPAQRDGAEPPHDRGVGEDVQRLDRQRAEGGNSKRGDPPVEIVARHASAGAGSGAGSGAASASGE